MWSATLRPKRHNRSLQAVIDCRIDSQLTISQIPQRGPWPNIEIIFREDFGPLMNLEVSFRKNLAALYWYEIYMRSFFCEYAQSRGLDPLDPNSWYDVKQTDIYECKVCATHSEEIITHSLGREVPHGALWRICFESFGDSISWYKFWFGEVC